MPSWTYTADPANSGLDAVRWLTGQTSTADELLVYDEEIAFALAQRGSNAYAAGSLVCESLAARYAAKPQTESVGQLGLSWGDIAQRFRQAAIDLRRGLALAGVSPYAGGISRSDQLTDLTDTDRVKPSFALKQDDNFRTGQRSSTAST